MEVVFYCDIITEDGEVVDSHFAFDEGTFDSQEELDKYMQKQGYAIGECCGYWGADVGILKDILIDE